MPEEPKVIQHLLIPKKGFLKRYWNFFLLIMLIVFAVAGFVFSSSAFLYPGLSKNVATLNYLAPDVSQKQIHEGIVVDISQVGGISFNPDQPSTAPLGLNYTLLSDSGEKKEVFVEFVDKKTQYAFLRVCKQNTFCPEFPDASEKISDQSAMQKILAGHILVGDHLKLASYSPHAGDYQVFVTRYE